MGFDCVKNNISCVVVNFTEFADLPKFHGLREMLEALLK